MGLWYLPAQTITFIFPQVAGLARVVFKTGMTKASSPGTPSHSRLEKVGGAGYVSQPSHGRNWELGGLPDPVAPWGRGRHSGKRMSQISLPVSVIPVSLLPGAQ